MSIENITKEQLYIILFTLLFILSITGLIISLVAFFQTTEQTERVNLNVEQKITTGSLDVSGDINANTVTAIEFTGNSLLVEQSDFVEIKDNGLDSGQIICNKLSVKDSMDCKTIASTSVTTDMLLLEQTKTGTFTTLLAGSTNENIAFTLPSTTGQNTQILTANITGGSEWTYPLKNNLTARSPPVSTDDLTKGYSVSSIWIIPNDGYNFICVDATESNAKWNSNISGNPFDQVLNINSSALFNSITSNTSLDVATTGFTMSLRTGASENYTLTFPNTQGVENSYLSNNGSGVMNWQVPVKNNTVSNSSPTLNDDNTVGYVKGSIWVNSATNQSFICSNNFTSAAVWREINDSNVFDQNLNTNGLVSFANIATPALNLKNGSFITELESAATEDCKIILPVSQGITDQYLALENSDSGQLVWRYNLTTNLNATTNPGPTDDITLGYTVGSYWINVNAESIFICVDSSAGFAQWERAVSKVTGTAGEILSSGGATPNLSLHPEILASINSWTEIAPVGNGETEQMMKYMSGRLQWSNIGMYPNSRARFVDKSGSDLNTGSNVSPFLTVAHAVSHVVNTMDPSRLNPMAINIGPGIFVELNPMLPVTGVYFTGDSSRSTIIRPMTPTSAVFVLTDNDISIENVRFESTTAQAPCLQLNGKFSSSLINSLVVGFSIGVELVGDGEIETLMLIQQSLLLGNLLGISASGVQFLVADTHIRGTYVPPPDVSRSGIYISGGTTTLYLTSALLGYLNTGVTCDASSTCVISSCNFIDNILGLDLKGSSKCFAQSCTWSKMRTGNIGIHSSDAGSQINIGGSTIIGRDYDDIIQGVGMVNVNGSVCNMQSMSISGCRVGIEAGELGDTASTRMFFNNSSFFDNNISLNQVGTSTLRCNNMSLDDITTMSIENTTNVKLIILSANGDNSYLTMGPLAKDQFTLIRVANSVITHENPELVYKPHYLDAETLAFEHGPHSEEHNMAIAVITPSGNVSIIGVTETIEKFSSVFLQCVISDNKRGWEIRKTDGTGRLEFRYENNIPGVNIAVDTTIMELDGQSKSLNLITDDSSLTFGVTKDTNLYRSSAGVLETDGDIIINNINASRAISTDSNSKLIASITTKTELDFVNGTTSNIQTQINSRLKLDGSSTMTGSLITTAGSLASPALQINGSGGIFSPSANNIAIVTNGISRLNIDSVGNLTVPSLTSGIIHSNNLGEFSSSLIVNDDIDISTITNDKLSSVSSMTIADTLVIRDANSNFSANMITIDGTPTNNTDVTNKGYVDTVAGVGVIVKSPAYVISSENIALSGINPSIDGVTVPDSETVLAIAQTSSIDNGAYVVESGTWARTSDFNTGTAGSAYFLITNGNTQQGSSFLCSTPNNTIGSEEIQFEQFSLPQSVTGVNEGGGIGIFSTSVGNTMNFKTLTSDATLTITPSNDEVSLIVIANSNNIPNTIAKRDATGTITASIIGHASLDLPLTGGILSGSLSLLNGTATAPNLNFNGNTATGISMDPIDTVNIISNSITSLSVSENTINTGISSYNINGLFKTTDTGLFTSSKLLVTDIDATTEIPNSNLATITTVGKVANSATTATPTNTINAIVSRDGFGNFSMNEITANSFVGTLTGSATDNLLKTGGDMTGPIRLLDGTVSNPSIRIGGTAAGLVSSSGNLLLVTNGSEKVNISTSGTVKINSLNVDGVVHTVAGNGTLNSSKIVNDDISDQPGDLISNSKLLTLTAAGKVANSATTATSLNIVSTIVTRDASNNFLAGTITADLIGSVTGSSSSNVLKAGDIMTGSLILPSGTVSIPSLAVGTVDTGLSSNAQNLVFSTDGSERLRLTTTGLQLPITMPNGILHNISGNDITSSLIINDDISASATIADTKLGIITTVGKVSNSATTATAMNVPSTIVLRDNSNNFTAGQITATSFSGALDGTASGNVSKSGDVMTNTLFLPSKTAANPALQIGGNPTGLASNSGSLMLITNAEERINIGSNGVVQIINMAQKGIVHTSTIGELSTGPIISEDIAVNAGILNTQLLNVPTSMNTSEAIVARDLSGDFSAGTITAQTTVTVGATAETQYRMPNSRGIKGQSFRSLDNNGAIGWANMGSTLESFPFLLATRSLRETNILTTCFHIFASSTNIYNNISVFVTVGGNSYVRMAVYRGHGNSKSYVSATSISQTASNSGIFQRNFNTPVEVTANEALTICISQDNDFFISELLNGPEGFEDENIAFIDDEENYTTRSYPPNLTVNRTTKNRIWFKLDSSAN